MKKRILSSALVIALLISMFSATVHAALLPNVTINLEGDVSGIRQGDDATVLIEGESLQASVRTPNGKRVITIAVANPKNGAYVSGTVGELSGTSVLRKKVSTNTFTATVTLTAKAPSSNLSATYEYISGTAYKPLPSAITTDSGDYAVSDSNQYVVGATVTRVSNAPAVNTTYDAIENGVTVGTWTLVSWNTESATMTADGVKFVGTWEYKEAEKYGVTYEYTGKTPANAPAVPVDKRFYYVGATYKVDATTIADIPTYDEYGNVDGNWKFNGWTDENNGTMVTGGVTITGS